MKKIIHVIIIFLSAFLLNYIWEQAHHVLYAHYQQGEITNTILFRAALFDASFITIVFTPIYHSNNFRKLWLIPVTIALVFAVVLERYALSTERWAYLPSMPIIPLLGSGLTPTIQLAVTGTASTLTCLSVATILYRKTH